MKEVVTEQFTYNGEDILQLKQEPLEGTLTSYFLISGLKTVLNPYHIGEKFVNINTGGIDIPIGASIAITYKIETDTSRFSLGERVKVLEKEVLRQREEIKILEEALRNRVDILTFKTYLKSLERKLNVDLIDNSFPLPYP